MKSLTDILRQYEIAFRDLITFKTRSTDPNAKDAIILKERRDWSFICTALDVIGDTTLAIKNFLDYGLEGLTDGNDDGEKYLRLYGVLNATYLQQEAIQVLYKKTDHVQQKFNNLKIRDIRNKIGAHSSEFEVRKHKTSKKEFESYILIRYSLVDHKIVYVNNESIAEDIYVDLKECLNEHLILIIDLLDKIYEKSILTLYKGNQKKKEELLDRISDLRRRNS